MAAINQNGVSAGRTIDFTPMPGSVGFILRNGVALNLTKWEPKLKGDRADISVFTSPVDPLNGVLHKEWLITAVEGEYTITGPRDESLRGWNPMPGDEGVGFLAYDDDFGFAINYKVSDVGGGSEATKHSEFSCTILATGLITFTGADATRVPVLISEL